jgi:malonyl-CoA decarboxylase
MVQALHAGAGTSAKGAQQSGGTMVNYLYGLKKVSQNHERFAVKHEVVASSEVRVPRAAGGGTNIPLVRTPHGQPAL